MGDAIISRTSKSNKISVVQETGNSETDVMSQKASTKLLAPTGHLHYSYDVNTGYFIKNQLERI